VDTHDSLDCTNQDEVILFLFPELAIFSSFQAMVSNMSWPCGVCQSADSKTKLYLLQWKKALTSASSFKDVQSLKLPPQEEIAQFIEQGNMHSVASILVLQCM
jgi:hypothetical protein